ncbi:MAG TPA: NUDIX hydrolase [Dehalococcoidia bacterium]|nr:NUDIX hydrolase [Dehalococcoidia bacterium]
MAQEVATGKLIRAAGGVLWRAVAGSNGNSVEVAIIHRPRYDDWSIPKGKLNAGEIEIEGAVREVTEETGFRATIVSPLGEVTYIKEDRPKVVRYWAMRAKGGVFTPGREVDELRWLPIDEAISLVTMDRDRDLLRRFLAAPPALRTVLLVRHGSAGSRSYWEEPDANRPLDDKGRDQADALIWLLTRWDVREIFCAPVERCVQTVEPLASAVGLAIQEQPLLAEEIFPGKRAEAIKWVRQAAHEDTASVLCSQGGVIPEILTRLASEDGVELPQPRPCKKGSMWSVTLAADRVYAAEYFAPLA